MALEGLKIADFSWVIAGPLGTKCLANYGATVVRIESARWPDTCRTSEPYVGGKPGLNRSIHSIAYNAGKYDISLDLRNARAISLAKRLVSWCDVVVENFGPGTIESLGLSYGSLKAIKPDVIMVSTSALGQTGTDSSVGTYGSHLASLIGFNYLVGWPDRPPVGSGTPYTDYVAPWYVMIAILSAMEYRRRTGRGAYIDLAQSEAGLSFLAPSILDFEANQRVAERIGNRSPRGAPHGVYRCRGEDSWCAIGVLSEREWGLFCQALGKGDLASDARFTRLCDRKKHEDQLDRIVEDWTSTMTASDVMNRLQAFGVAAGVVQHGPDLIADPQLAHRQHFQWLNHTEVGLSMHVAPPFKLSGTPPVLRPSPTVGEHNEFVCRELLGISDEEFLELLNAGVFE